MRCVVYCLVLFAIGCDHGMPPEQAPHEKACAGKSCGDACDLCERGAKGCDDTALSRACSADGECVPAPVECKDD